MTRNNGMPLWGKIVLVCGAALMIAGAIHRLRRPTLTPEQAHNVDVDARYEAWQRSPGQVTFVKLQQACAPFHEDTDDIADTFQVMGQPRPTPQDLKRASTTARRLLQKHRGSLTVVRTNLSETFAAPPQRDPDAPMPYFPNFRHAAHGFSFWKRSLHGGREIQRAWFRPA